MNQKKKSDELILAYKEIAYQIEEKGKRAAELIIANIELSFQNSEKEKRAEELLIANLELAFQNKEKGKRAAELILVNKKLAFQMEERAKRAGELVIANTELSFQNDEKEKRAEELLIANLELVFQNEEKGKRAAELTVINEELAFQMQEKGKRAEELVIANTELSFQNNEKENRAEELLIANLELVFQNKEKEKRAEELILLNKELAFQIEAKEKQATELLIANKELEQFALVASHDLLEPLRTVSNYIQLFELDYGEWLDPRGLNYIRSMKKATERMKALIDSLLLFSRLGYNKKLAYADITKLIGEVIEDLNIIIKDADAIIEVSEMPGLNVYEVEIRQVFQNLITNAIKFRKKNVQMKIKIECRKTDGVWEFSVSDNGIGISPSFFSKIFDIFQRLHSSDEYEGSGIGLANCKKIIHLHQGQIWVKPNPEDGTIFCFTIPILAV